MALSAYEYGEGYADIQQGQLETWRNLFMSNDYLKSRAVAIATDNEPGTWISEYLDVVVELCQQRGFDEHAAQVIAKRTKWRLGI